MSIASANILRTIRDFRHISKKPPEYEKAVAAGLKLLEDPKKCEKLSPEDFHILFWLNPGKGLSIPHVKARVPMEGIRYCYANLPNKTFIHASDRLTPEMIHNVLKKQAGRKYILDLLDPIPPTPEGFGANLLNRLLEKEVYSGLSRGFRKKIKTIAAKQL
jgi:hypothetical protein